MDKMRCKVCGKWFDESSFRHLKICSDVCFYRDFWLQIIKEREKHPIIDGVCYYIDRNNLDGNGGMQGLGGRKFTIKFKNGEIIETTNLWHNGTVPQEFRHILEDNAEFIPNVKVKEGDKF